MGNLDELEAGRAELLFRQLFWMRMRCHPFAIQALLWRTAMLWKLQHIFEYLKNIVWLILCSNFQTHICIFHTCFNTFKRSKCNSSLRFVIEILLLKEIHAGDAEWVRFSEISFIGWPFVVDFIAVTWLIDILAGLVTCTRTWTSVNIEKLVGFDRFIIKCQNYNFSPLAVANKVNYGWIIIIGWLEPCRTVHIQRSFHAIILNMLWTI